MDHKTLFKRKQAKNFYILDSLKIGIDIGKAYLVGRATNSEDQNLDMDITEIFNNVILD